MAEFYLSLPSNTNRTKEVSRENTTSDFRIQLAKDIKLAGEWEMALVEIQFPYSFDNVTNTKEEWMSANEIMIRNDDLSIYEQVRLTPCNYDTIASLVAAVQQQIQIHEMSIEYDTVHKRVIFRLPENYMLTLSEALTYMLGFKQIHITGDSQAEYPPDLRCGLDALYVYCDIAELGVVGNSMEPLLRIIPVQGDYGQMIHHDYFAPHYVNVLQKEFSSIHITIKTDRNKPVAFKFGKSILTLHFKRKR